MVRRWAGFVLAAATLVVGVPAQAASAATSTDPAQNIAPSPAYWTLCLQQGPSSQQCTDTIVQAINSARSLEGVGQMVLPAGFASLTTPEQTFVLSNLERVDRGLPPVTGMVESLNALAADAAAADADPMLSGWTVGPFQVNGWSSIWAGDLNALAADYDWMYNDGWGPLGSYNLDCQSATGSGCWGHRQAILRSGSNLITGVGSQQQSQWMSVAQIFVSGSGTNPPFTYSWADVTGDDSVPPAVTGTADVRPAVAVDAWATSSTRRTVAATVTPALGQPVRLRRLTISGWQTVRRTTATATVTFDGVRRGAYRLVVGKATGSLRTVTSFRLS